MKNDILRQLAELERMPFAGLRKQWQELFGGEPPGYNRTFLIKRLSYRIQERAYGGIKPETRAELDRMLNEEGYDELGRLGPKEAPRIREDQIVPGTTLIRYWKGERHTVTVLDEGFEYLGQPHKSLSAIAKKISGTKWSGPAFFGLRKKGGASVKRRGSDGE